MLKHVTAIMIVLVTLVVLLLMATVGHCYYFILDLEVTAILNLMVLILSLHNHGQKLHEGNGTALLLITNKANDEQERLLYRLFLAKQREIVLHYLQVHIAVFWNH